MFLWDNERPEFQLEHDRSLETIKENQNNDRLDRANIPTMEWGDKNIATPISQIVENMIIKDSLEALYYVNQIYWDKEDIYEALFDVCSQLGLDSEDYPPSIDIDGFEVKIRLY